MQKTILEEYPDTSVSVSIVWIKMLQGDNASKAKRAAQSLGDARVRHFYDPKGLVGKAIAQSLGESSQIAWDIYLFYPPGERWNREPPKPIAWVHQLSDNWMEHFRYGDDLETELRSIAGRLLPPLKR